MSCYFLSIMKFFKDILKETRTGKGLLVKDTASQTGIDQALISKFESGTRIATRMQVVKLSEVYGVPEKTLLVPWLSEKIYAEIEEEPFAKEALMVAEEFVGYAVKEKKKALKAATYNTKELDILKKELNSYRKNDSYRIAQALELEYTFESNRIEGNTLTLQETDLVINEGLTIGGKSMREHLEAINHNHAVEFVKDLVQKKSPVTEKLLLQIHHLVLRGIDVENAGRYRKLQVMIKGSKHIPPQAFLVPKQMEELFIWYNKNKSHLHPVVLAANLHEKLVTIHPFIDGNGRTARLLMNLVLLQHGFVIANIKGDNLNRIKYYNVLEQANAENDNSAFVSFIIEVEASSLKRYIDIIKV